MRSSFFTGLLLLLLCLPALAMAELKAFSAGSLDDIKAEREGRPFLLVLWSIDCPPCLKELEHIGQLRAQFPEGGLALISTDGADYADEVNEALSRSGLATAENWIFSGSFPEQLRYHVDPDCYGELPRAYFYDAGHQRAAKSGALSMVLLQQWITATTHKTATAK